MVDGERRPTVRPLRPAAPPDGDAGPVPRPRRDEPTSPPAKTAPETASTAEPTAAEPAAAKPALKSTAAKPAAEPAAAEPEAEPAAAEPEAESATAEPAAAEVAAAGGRRRRVPFAHAGRVRPRQLAVGAARATRAWSRRPSGRTTLPALFLLALVGAAVAVGAILVPAAVREPEPVAVEATSATPAQGVPQTGTVPGVTAVPGLTAAPGLTGLPGTAGPSGSPPAGGATANPVLPAGRPADALTGWAQRVGVTTGIPATALQAYGYAELVLAQTHRSCQLSWTTLAAIGFVESRHGTAGGATLRPDGLTSKEILGARLDGQGGRSRILDTDQGRLDGDTTFDRALGPMQFIPSTWQEIGADADNDGVKNPHDIDDAALAAGEYLCKAGRNMTIPGDWWGAILSYNDVRRYAQEVFDKADEYGRKSGT
ncbi:lytic murein transglycosylase [Micromonospora sp. WMMD975]|uniref:lytic transglycosylase domain-containing protein n=1 Tax=Micromonospora sp. WMMD975 TaxID=3016087 RepID=UPI00249A4380|nr:lytic murein transglycosylase [Micromonospora sp. WMMD975]WFE36784.1 lytic murein transglycosylase [Micromonospora sp. WMMD975]